MNIQELIPRAEAARREGREVVAVVGLGFVGTAVLAALASRSNGTRSGPGPLVIGIDRDTPEGRERVEHLRRGQPPVGTGDPRVDVAMRVAAKEPRRLLATDSLDAVACADVVVACIGLEVQRAPGQVANVDCTVHAYAAFVESLGRRMGPDTLLVVESTLPIGACDQLLVPALRRGMIEQGIDVEAQPPAFAYCPERVTPGPALLDSVASGPRGYAGADRRSAERARSWLSSSLGVAEEALWEHASLRAAELSKLMENAYRATNIAFVDEWARLAEVAGVDLYEVIESIRTRRGTHDNMMRPGLGVGGHCLTKDALLAGFGARELLSSPVSLPFSERAILTNEDMPRRAVEWAREHFAGDLAARRALILGVTYLPGVADTRHSPSEAVARELLAERVEVHALDATVERWAELASEAVELHTATESLAGNFDLLLLALQDPDSRSLARELALERLCPGALVLDPWNVLGHEFANELARRGTTVRVYGRGDLPRPPATS